MVHQWHAKVVFTVLVFGLTTAPFIFTQVVKVLIKHWRSMAIRAVAFVDDILGRAGLKKKHLGYHLKLRKI